MIHLTSSHSGGELARALAGEPEEMAYFLMELSALERFDAEELAEYIHEGQKDEIAIFLRGVARAVENSP